MLTRHWFALCVSLICAAIACSGNSESFPGTVRGADSRWIARNDSLRAAFLATDPHPTVIPESQEALLATAFAEALRQARVNMRGLGHPRHYCVSGGPPHDARPVPEGVRRLIQVEDAEFVHVSRCAVDRALGVWIDKRERAWLLWADSVHVEGDSATVTVGYHAESLEAAGWLCSLRRTSGQWKVGSCQMEWIS